MNKGVSIFEDNERRVIKGLGFHTPDPVRDLREMVRGTVKKFGKNVAFKFKKDGDKIYEITYEKFGRDIDFAGTALMNMGLKGSRIAILSENRYEWAVSYYAIVNGTGVVVPLDKYLPAAEVENLIVRGEVEAVFYSPGFHPIIKEMADKYPQLKLLVCFENQVETEEKFVSFPDLLKKGEQLLNSNDRSFIDAEIDRYGMSILLFTSGTTSMSKGVMLSHSNIATNITSITTMITITSKDIYLSLLPLHHTFENTIGMSYMIHRGVCIAYCQGIRHITQNLAEFHVSLLVGVPAIFETVYNRVMEGIEKSGRKKAFDKLVILSEILRKIGIDLRRKLFKSVFEKLGPDLRLAVSGAAPLDIKVIEGFDKIGLEFIQGYGLTETSPVLAANNDVINVFGTVGCPMYGVQLSIDNPDEAGMGEIIAKGGNVMLGYYKDEEATKEAFTEDGWFKTGDLGVIDEDGNLKITGRAKSMIVLNNGKKAFPEEYEIILNNMEYVKDSFVWGNTAPDGDVQVCGLISIDSENVEDIDGKKVVKEEIRKKIEQAVRDMNKNMPQYKIIRYCVFTTQEMIKTTTLKIKRKPQYDIVKKWLDEQGVDMRKASMRVID